MEQGLRTVMARSYGEALGVEQVCHVLGVQAWVEEGHYGRVEVVMTAVDRAAKPPEGLGGPACDVEQPMMLDLKVDLLEVIHGGFPSNGFGDARSSGFELVLVLLVGRAFDRDLVDHVPAAHEGGHFCEGVLLHRQASDAGGSEHFVGGDGEEIHVHVRHVNPRVRCALGRVEQHPRS